MSYGYPGAYRPYPGHPYDVPHGDLARSDITAGPMARQHSPQVPDRLAASAIAGHHPGTARDVARQAAERAAASVPPPKRVDIEHMRIPELEKLTDEQVEELLADQVRFEGFVASLPPLVDNKPAIERCNKLSAEVEELSGRTAQLFAEAEAKIGEALAARRRCEQLRAEKQAAEAMFSVDGVAAALRERADNRPMLDDEVEKLRHGTMTPDDFVERYLKAVTEYYENKYKSDSIDSYLRGACR